MICLNHFVLITGLELQPMVKKRLDAELVQQFVLLGVLLQRTAQTHLKALKVSTSLYRIDIIYIRVDFLPASVLLLSQSVFCHLEPVLGISAVL